MESCQNGFQKQSVSESDNSNWTSSSSSSSSYVVDMERFSHFIEKNINANSRLTLQRSLSRKGFVRSGGDNKKINPTISNLNERSDATICTTSPSAATLHGGSSTPEKPLGATDHHSTNTQVHHQITITNGNLSNDNTVSESKISSGKRFSFRRSSHSSWAIAPSRILLFFAIVSSMGTILLIYFTLSMTKLNKDGASPDS